MRFRRPHVIAAATIALAAATATASYAAVSSSGASTTAATGGLPVIYADPGFAGAITKADADAGSVEIHFLDARGSRQSLTVTQSPWSTWRLGGLYATAGTVTGGVGNVMGIGTVLNNYTFQVSGTGIKYAVCLTFQKGSAATSLHYSSSLGWQVIRPPEPPCPPGA